MMDLNKLTAIGARIGRPAELVHNTLRIAVTVVDARAVFGRVDYLVTPIAGSGSAWVTSRRVLFSPRAPEAGADAGHP